MQHGQGKHPAVNELHLRQNGHVMACVSPTGFSLSQSSGIFTDKETRLQLKLERVEALSRNEAPGFCDVRFWPPRSCQQGSGPS